jgi:cadmium resistance protein CadD (predicted permease)
MNRISLAITAVAAALVLAAAYLSETWTPLLLLVPIAIGAWLATRRR